jgi:hypothetical protein
VEADQVRKYWDYKTIPCPPIYCIVGDSETDGKKDMSKLTKSEALKCKGTWAKQIVDCLVDNKDWIPRKNNRLIGKIHAG